MPLEFDFAKTPQENVSNILTDRIAYIISQLRDAENQDEAVHEARKSFKQIRAVLRLIRPMIDEPTYREQNRYFRDLAAQLAPLRDGFVIIETLKLIKPKFTDENLLALIDGLIAELTTDYQAERDAFLHSNAIQSVVTALQAYKLPDGITNLPDKGFSSYSKGLKQTYKRGRRGLKHAMRTNDAIYYHEWRKATKYLWYQIRLLMPIEPTVLTEYATRLKNLSEELGNAHDLLVVEEALMHHPELASETGRNFHQQLVTLRREYEHDTHVAGLEIFGEKPGVFGKRIANYNQLQQEISGVES
jgi:CHAD domain-containing protein